MCIKEVRIPKWYFELYKKYTQPLFGSEKKVKRKLK